MSSSRRATPPSSRSSRRRAPSSSGSPTCPTSPTATPTAARSFGRTGNAYDVRFSPGGSSGGVVTAVAANMAVLGNGTDTGNSIRMPAATSALVGVYPTRGLVSIAGIAPLDWLLDNTGPIARTVDDAAIALEVMAGPDPLDPRTVGAPAAAQRAAVRAASPEPATLKGKRFGVPAFVLAGDGVPFHGIPATVPAAAAEKLRVAANMPLRPETRAMFMKAVEALRAAGAEVIVDDSILPTSLRAHREPRRDLRLHAGRDRPVPRHVRPAGVPLGRRVPEGRRHAALHVVDRRRGLLPQHRRRPHRAAAARRRSGRRAPVSRAARARCWPPTSSRSIA